MISFFVSISSEWPITLICPKVSLITLRSGCINISSAINNANFTFIPASFLAVTERGQNIKLTCHFG